MASDTDVVELPADLEQANHWTATRPDTRFTTLHIVSIALPRGFAAMSVSDTAQAILTALGMKLRIR